MEVVSREGVGLKKRRRNDEEKRNETDKGP
jgi:hypothetical protein